MALKEAEQCEDHESNRRRVHSCVYNHSVRPFRFGRDAEERESHRDFGTNHAQAVGEVTDPPELEQKKRCQCLHDRKDLRNENGYRYVLGVPSSSLAE